MNKDNILNPTPSLLVKLGSIAVHVEEFLSPNGHPNDKASIESLLADDEIKSWIKEMDKLGMMPKKRN